MPRQKAVGLRAVFRRELKRMGSTRLYLFLMVVFPLLSFALLWATFHQQVPRDLPVAVHDADHSALSRRMIRMLDATSTLRVAAAVADMETGKKHILEKKAYALIVFPLDFEKDIRKGKSSPVVCFYNAQYLLAGSLITREVRNVAATASVTLNVGLRLQKGEMKPAAVTHAEAIRVELHGLFNPGLNYVHYLVSALLPTMLQIFIILVSVQSAGSELKEGTARQWLECAGSKTWKAVAGKMLPQTMVFSLMGLFMISLLYRFMGVPLRGSAGMIALGTLLFVLSYQAIGLLLTAWLANLRLATSVSAFYTGPAFAFTGITFPYMAMPLPGKLWANILPLTHYLRLLVEQAVRGAQPADSLPELVILSVFTIIALSAAGPRLAHVMRDKRYWGRT